ncbi:hypothetical protein GB937_009987 [Aspergillus fischeri]|nr:hypothetical protein GB937_009987 [Aspergillus fischeri]
MEQTASEAGVGWSDARKLSSCGGRKRRWVDKQKEVADTEQKRRLTGEKKRGEACSERSGER